MKRKSECRLSLVSRADKEYLPTSMRFTRPRANGETWRTDDKSVSRTLRTDGRTVALCMTSHLNTKWAWVALRDREGHRANESAHTLTLDGHNQRVILLSEHRDGAVPSLDRTVGPQKRSPIGMPLK